MSQRYVYKVIRTTNMEELEGLLNRLAEEGWHPVLYSISSLASTAAHHVILKREAP